MSPWRKPSAAWALLTSALTTAVAIPRQEPLLLPGFPAKLAAMLSSELSILLVYGLIVAVTLVLQVMGFTGQLGMGYILSSRDEQRTPWGMAARLERALTNSVAAMALFAPAVIVLALRHQFSEQTLLASQVFLAARVVYLPTYVFGINGVRTLVWLIGFFATIFLYLLAF